MILTRSTSLVTVSLFCLVAMPASGALGATKKKAPVRPTIGSVSPMAAGVGDLLTIKGKSFLLGKNKNAVFFKVGTRPAVTAKAVQSTRTTMKVIVPKSLEKYLSVAGGVVQPTRVRLKVLAKRFGKAYSALRISPTIALGTTPVTTPPGSVTGPASDCDGDGIVNSLDLDDDNDLLTDVEEVGLKLNPCKADTDGDGIEDGYEYKSALDLNGTVATSLPYPIKRPYPNPLDGNDAKADFDGDGLTMAQEYAMWKTYGPATLALSYSAGLKKSNTPNVRPILDSSSQGRACILTASEACNDDYRDVDGDALSNVDEFNERMQPQWWADAFPDEEPYFEHYDGTSAIDPDSDGDGLVDGADNVDHDPTPTAGYTNLEEVNGRFLTDPNARLKTNPFNPCLPDPVYSPTCSHHPPLPFTYVEPPVVPIPWP